MTVAELGQRMSSAELSEWIAFDRLYGLPDSYFVAGTICAALDSLMAEKPRPVSAFVPYFGADGPAEQSGAEILGRLKAIAARQSSP